MHVTLPSLSNDKLYLSEALHVALSILPLSDLILQSAEMGRKTSIKDQSLIILLYKKNANIFISMEIINHKLPVMHAMDYKFLITKVAVILIFDLSIKMEYTA